MHLQHETTSSGEQLITDKRLYGCPNGNDDTVTPCRNPRGPIVNLSSASKRRYINTVNNFPDLTHLATLTYGQYAPLRFEEIRRECKRLCVTLRSNRISGIWRIELQKRGAVHFHILISAQDKTNDEIKEIFRKFSRSSNEYTPGNTDIQPYDGLPRFTNYMRKFPGVLPVDWHGRFWAEFGRKIIAPDTLLEDDDFLEKKKERLRKILPKLPECGDQSEESSL